MKLKKPHKNAEFIVAEALEYLKTCGGFKDD